MHKISVLKDFKFEYEEQFLDNDINLDRLNNINEKNVNKDKIDKDKSNRLHNYSFFNYGIKLIIIFLIINFTLAIATPTFMSINFIIKQKQK